MAWVFDIVCQCGSTVCAHTVVAVNTLEVERWGLQGSWRHRSLCMDMCCGHRRKRKVKSWWLPAVVVVGARKVEGRKAYGRRAYVCGVAAVNARKVEGCGVTDKLASQVGVCAAVVVDVREVERCAQVGMCACCSGH